MARKRDKKWPNYAITALEKYEEKTGKHLTGAARGNFLEAQVSARKVHRVIEHGKTLR